MNGNDENEFARLLKNAIVPIGTREMPSDLWAKVDSRSKRVSFQIRWFDWALAAIVLCVCLLIPEIAAGLIFHL